MAANLGSYSLDQLVELITREVMAAYPPETGEQGCGVCSRGKCDGQCVQTNPDGARQVVSAGADRLSARLGVTNVAADLARMIDHTLLKDDAKEDQVRQL